MVGTFAGPGQTLGGGGYPVPVGGEGDLVGPSAEDQDRWENPRVREFRKKLGTYVIVNAAIEHSTVIASFGTKDAPIEIRKVNKD